jgi:hypothetical protein
MLKGIFGDQMKLTVNLTVKMLLAGKSSIRDSGLQTPPQRSRELTRLCS